jgi:hypothetical protein
MTTELQEEKVLVPDPKELPSFKESAEEVAAVVAASKIAQEVVDDATEEAATDLIAEAKGAVKAAERRREAEVKPHLDAQRAINGAFKELLGPLGGVVRGQEAQVLGHRRRQQEAEAAERKAAEEEERKRVEEERKRLEENARKRQEEEDAKAKAEEREAKKVKAFEIPDPEPPAPAPASRGKSRVTASGKRGTMVDNWKYEVIAPANLPPAYTKTVVDHDAIKQAVRHGIRDISGVRIYNDAHLAVSDG